jgi:putative transposase
VKLSGFADCSSAWPVRAAHLAGTHQAAIAKLRARETDRRRDWVEKTTTDVARRFDTIRVEDLRVRVMTRSARGTRECPGTKVEQKRGLNREISRQGWGLLVGRLKHQAVGRLEVCPGGLHVAAMLPLCGHVAPKTARPKRFRVRRLRGGAVQR